MPNPSNVRRTNRNVKLGEKPAVNWQTEYQAIEIIKGIRRPSRSAIQPAEQAPSKRIHSVRVTMTAAAVRGTWNSWLIGTSRSRKMVKSKASRVQPSQPAVHASHWSLVGSLPGDQVF
jgi:hypothetical protein